MVPPVVKMRNFSMQALASVAEGWRQGIAVDGDAQIQEEHQVTGFPATYPQIEGAEHGVGTDEARQPILHPVGAAACIAPDVAHVHTTSQVEAAAETCDHVADVMGIDEMSIEDPVTTQLPLALACQRQ